MRRVAIVGVGLTPHVRERPDVSWPELLAEAVRAALDDAALGADDVEATVFGSAIQIQEGVEHPGKWAVDALASRGKPHLRVHTGGTVGASAVSAAFYAVASGDHDVVLAVAGTQRSGATGRDAQRALATASDPIRSRRFATGTPAGAALLFQAYMARSGATERHAAVLAEKQRAHGALNPTAHLREPVSVDQVLASEPVAPPIKRLDICPTSVGACALVLAADDRARRISPRPAWIRGLAACVDDPATTGRGLFDLEALRTAAARAYRQAGIDRPADEVHVAEVYDAFSYQEMVWLEGLFLAPEDRGFAAVEDGSTRLGGRIPVNPSGGVLCTNNGSDAAMVRIAEAALQISGRAGARQVPGARTGVAMSWGGRTQFFHVAVLGADA